MMYRRGYYGNNGCLGYNFIGNGWNLVIMVGVLVLVVATVIYLARRTNQRQDHTSSLELLKMKYVQGELSEEEYLNRKNILNRK